MDDLLNTYKRLKKKNNKLPAQNGPDPKRIELLNLPGATSCAGTESLPDNFADELSALCDAFLATPGPMAAVLEPLPQSSRFPGDLLDVASQYNCAQEPTPSAGEQAVLDLVGMLTEETEKDDFGDDPAAAKVAEVGVEYICEPTEADVGTVRRAADVERKRWLKAHTWERQNRTKMQKLYDDAVYHRGCARGACCVYSMWYNPKFGGHGNCTHQCTVSPGAVSRCGPSLLALDLPPLNHPGYFRRDQRGNDAATGDHPAPTCQRTRRVYTKLRPNSHPPAQAALPAPAPCGDDHQPVVAPSTTCHPEPDECRPKRTRHPMSTVSRIRRRMGQRTFGKLEGRKKVLSQLSRSLEENCIGVRFSTSGEVL